MHCRGGANTSWQSTPRPPDCRQSNGGATGVINFNWILRTLELEQRSQTATYGRRFTAAPTAGFSTYGEEYIGHINQTATMLVFK